MTGKRIGYARVSTVEQNPGRQLEGILLDKTFIEHASGASLARPQLQIMLDYVREDDYVYVHSMDRLARNIRDLRKLVDLFVHKGCTIHFVKENLIFNGQNDAISTLMLSIMGAVAEFELSRIHERQAEGIALAKREGKYLGRKRCLDNEKIQILREQFSTRIPILQIARDLDVSAKTIYKYLGELGLKPCTPGIRFEQ